MGKINSTYAGQYSSEILIISSGVKMSLSQPHTSPRFSLEEGIDPWTEKQKKN